MQIEFCYSGTQGEEAHKQSLLEPIWRSGRRICHKTQLHYLFENFE